MAEPLPAELSRLLNAADPPAREEAWAAFAKAHSRLLLHTARSLARDYDAAMDAYAFVLEQLRQDDCRRLRSYVADGRSKFSTWLVVVARRLCLDLHRQRYGRARDPTPERVEARGARRRLADLVAEQVDLTRLAPRTAGTLETELQARQLSEALESALRGLDPRDRLLLKLRFEDDLSAREIANVMKFPTPFHVYRRLNALFGSLRQTLERKGVRDAHP